MLSKPTHERKKKNYGMFHLKSDMGLGFVLFISSEQKKKSMLEELSSS
jgi:hypothetical protein